MKKVALLLILVLSLAIPASAVSANPPTSVESVNVTRSIDTTFDLDFDSSSNWTIDFDNEGGWFHYNHTKVDVFYDSFVGANYAPTVTVSLQKLEDGSYETVETKYVRLGRTITFDLPEGGTLTNYRLHFSATSTANTPP